MMPTVRDRPVLLERYPDGVREQVVLPEAHPRLGPRLARDDHVETINGTRVAGARRRRPRARAVGREHGVPRPARLAVPGVDPDDRRDAHRPRPVARRRRSTWCARRPATCATCSPSWASRRLRQDHREQGHPRLRARRAGMGLLRRAWRRRRPRPRDGARRHPDLITDKWWKEERGARVFVDFNQNAPAQEHVRRVGRAGRVGAQVSTPFSWDELDSIDPEALTIATVPDRLAERGDPWAVDGRRAVFDRPARRAVRTDLADGVPDAPGRPSTRRCRTRRPACSRAELATATDRRRIATTSPERRCRRRVASPLRPTTTSPTSTTATPIQPTGQRLVEQHDGEQRGGERLGEHEGDRRRRRQAAQPVPEQQVGDPGRGHPEVQRHEQPPPGDPPERLARPRTATTTTPSVNGQRQRHRRRHPGRIITVFDVTEYIGVAGARPPAPTARRRRSDAAEASSRDHQDRTAGDGDDGPTNHWRVRPHATPHPLDDARRRTARCRSPPPCRPRPRRADRRGTRLCTTATPSRRPRRAPVAAPRANLGRRRRRPEDPSTSAGPTSASHTRSAGSTRSTRSASAPLRPRQHRPRPALVNNDDVVRGRRPGSTPPPPRHGDRHLGAVGRARAPRLRGQPRRHLPRPRPADVGRHRHPALRDERLAPPTDVHFVQMWVPPDTESAIRGYEQLDINAELARGGSCRSRRARATTARSRSTSATPCCGAVASRR
jgi:hypothetical protein